MSFVFEGATQRKLLYFAFINNSALEKNGRGGAVCLWASLWLHHHYRNRLKSIMCLINYANLIYLHYLQLLMHDPFYFENTIKLPHLPHRPLLFWSTNDPEISFLLLWSFPAVHGTVVIMAQAIQKLVAKVPTAVGGKLIHVYPFYQLLIELAVAERTV